MKIRISPACLLLLPAVIIFPARSVPFISAVLIHELGHLTVCLLFDIRVNSLYVIPLGIEIACDKAALGYKKDCLLSLAGCFFNLFSAALSLALFGGIETFALCSLLLCAFNLLPIRNLDGGSALYDIFAILFSQRAAKTALDLLSAATLLLLFTLSAYILFFGGNGFLLFLSAVYMFINIFIKK